MNRSFQQDTHPVLETNPMYFDEGTRTRVTRLDPWERHGRREAILSLQCGQPMIYAARVHDNLVKIGCSTDLYQRLASLKGELLGFRFGDFDEESEIHRDLKAHVHHGREWYHPTPAVMAFVNELREPLGLEPLAA